MLYSVSLQYCWLEMKTTDIDNVTHSEDQGFRNPAFLQGCLLSCCLFYKSFIYKKYSVYAPTANGNKANDPEKEVNKLFTVLGSKGSGCVCWGKRDLASKSLRATGLARLSPGPCKASGLQSQEVTYMWYPFQLLSETDAPRSISLSSIKDVLLSHRAFSTRARARLFSSISTWRSLQSPSSFPDQRGKMKA